MTTALAQTAAQPNAKPLQIETDPAAALERVNAWVDGFFRLLPNIAVALVVVLLFIGFAMFARSSMRRWSARRQRDNLGEVLGGFLFWAITLLGTLLGLTVVLPTLHPGDLLAGLGVGSVAIGFAFKDILQNWLAGLLILFRQPFEVGDQIVVSGYEGTVERIDSRATDIRTYDGRRVLIPNSDVYTGAVVINTAYAKRRSEYDVGIGYGDDIGHAREVILEAMHGLEGVEAEPAPEALPWGLDASWVSLRVRWWTDSRRSDVVIVHGRVIEAIKNALDRAGIDMPFETAVNLWHDQTEELDGVRGHQREGWPAPGDGRPPPRPARERTAAQRRE